MFETHVYKRQFHKGWYSHRFQDKYLFGMRRSERTHDTCLMGREGREGDT